MGQIIYLVAVTLALYGFTAVEALCSGCVNDPPEQCNLWPMSPFEVKLMSPFCENGKLCYIADDLSYLWTKCVGYCAKTETLPGNYGSGGIKKCKPKNNKCCQPTKLEKMEVCTVCCEHWMCSSQRRAGLMQGGMAGRSQPQPGPAGAGSASILSKEEVEKRARQEYLEEQRKKSPVIKPLGRPIYLWNPSGDGGAAGIGSTGGQGQGQGGTDEPSVTTETPKARVLPPKRKVCPPWFQKKVYDVPRGCKCQ